MTKTDLSNWQACPPPGPTHIAGVGCVLERLDPTRHGPDLFRTLHLEAATWKYLPYGPFATETDHRAWLEEMAPSSDPYFYAILDPDGQALGVASYLRITPDVGVIEIGHICLSPLLQRTPMATAALTAMIAWAFEAGYRRVEWKCDAANAASMRAAQRLGLSYEGLFRQASIVKGRNRDTAWFAATDDAWPALKAAYAAWCAPQNFDAEGQQKTRLTELTRPLLVPPPPAPPFP